MNWFEKYPSLRAVLTSNTLMNWFEKYPSLRAVLCLVLVVIICFPLLALSLYGPVKVSFL